MTPKQRLAAKIGAAAAALVVGTVAHFEGYVPWVYKDPIGRLAACYGHDDQTMTLGQKFTRQECEELLSQDLLKHAQALDCIKRPLSDGQKAAFVSFAYNVGNGAFCGSTLARKANAGDMAGACAQLSVWTCATVKPGQGDASGQCANAARTMKQLPGLVARRAAERKLCESP